MNKVELITAVAESLGETKARSAQILESIFGGEGVIQGSLHKGETVRVSGFGVFSVKQRKARLARNPKTGTKVQVPAKKIPHFRFLSEAKSL